MASGKKHREWWSKLTPEKRAEIQSQQRAQQEHHGRDDLACPACGTDSSVGCIAGAA